MSRPERAKLPVGLLAAFFLGSGFSAVAYQVILSRFIQLIVGATAYAVSALLVAFMLGMSIGAALGGRWADRARHPLRVYAIAEAAIGAYCLAFPLLFPRLEALYLFIAPEIDADSLLERNVARFFVGVISFLVPSIFMGITTPAFARAVAHGHSIAGGYLARIYGWNTLGAALGAFFTAYVLVPELGFTSSLALISVMNFGIAAWAYVGSHSVPIEAPAGHGGVATSPRSLVAAVVLLTALSTGFITFALEIVWTHLLAALLGNSSYAFGLMLGSLLLGLSGGTLLARRLVDPAHRPLDALGLVLIGAGLSVSATLGLWDEVPGVFLAVADMAPTFAFMELLRFLVALGLMLLPTTLFGASFPLLLHLSTAEAAGFARRVGTVYAVNTAGAVLGALAGSYLILPALGSFGALKLLAVAVLLLGASILSTVARFKQRRILAALAMACAAFTYWHPTRWDFNALNMAAAIYLGASSSATGKILYQNEDPRGGLTAVVEDARGVRTLLTNGKFQGDNGPEVPIEYRLASIPTLFTPERERALVIGLGTGVTLAALKAHGFKETVCAELSPPIIEAAKTYFGDVNHGVLEDPRVRIVPEDGRSVLREASERYDVISVQVTTIWFAGVGPVYSQEFYRLAQSKLRQGGVLLQWFPFHHVSPRNLFVVVNTIRSVFPHVSVWTHGHQGFVVAGNQPLRIDLDSVRADLRSSELDPFLETLQSRSPLEILGDLIVTDQDADRFLDTLASMLRTKRSLVSTDAWPTLEYETPKDILDNFLYFGNRELARRFRSEQPFPFRGEPSDEERALLRMSFFTGWNDPRASAVLAEGAAVSERLSRIAARFFTNEVTGREAFARSFEAGPPAAPPYLHLEARCKAWQTIYPAEDHLELRVEHAHGINLHGTAPSDAADGVSHPEATMGWRARPLGRAPEVELALKEAAEISRIEVHAAPLDGHRLRTRMAARDRDGKWWSLLVREEAELARCMGPIEYLLPRGAPAFGALSVELIGEASIFGVSLREVFAFPRVAEEGS